MHRQYQSLLQESLLNISKYRVKTNFRDSKRHVQRVSHNFFNGINARPTYF